MLTPHAAQRVKDTKTTLDKRTADLAAAGVNTVEAAAFDYVQAEKEHGQAIVDARNEMGS
jgi:hypothetical protein